MMLSNLMSVCCQFNAAFKLRWKQVYFTVRAMFTLLKLLRLSDTGKPVMGSVVKTYNDAKDTLEASLMEEGDLFGCNEGEPNVTAKILTCVRNDEAAFKQDYILVGYFLNPALFDEVTVSPIYGELVAVLQRVIAKHNSKTSSFVINNMTYEAQASLVKFLNKSGASYIRDVIWNDPNLKTKPHVWHHTNSTTYRHNTLGMVASRVLSKPAEIGPSKRNWEQRKLIQSSVRNRLDDVKADHVLFCNHSFQHDQDFLKEDSDPFTNQIWSESEYNFDLRLERWQTELYADLDHNVSFFKNYIEPFKVACRKAQRQGSVLQLLGNYRGMKFLDDDGDLWEVSNTRELPWV